MCVFVSIVESEIVDLISTARGGGSGGGGGGGGRIRYDMAGRRMSDLLLFLYSYCGLYLLH